MPKSELSPGLLAALAVAVKHIEPVMVLPPSAKYKSYSGNADLIKVRRNRMHNKMAAQSRRRNRK